MSVQPPRGGGPRAPAAHSRASTCSPAAARTCATSPRSARSACSRFAARAGATGASRLRSRAEGERKIRTADDRRRRQGARRWLLQAPPGARACYVMAHGAGAGMTHPFMAAFAQRSRRARHRDAALPVSVHGAGVEASRFAQGRARDGPRRGRRSVAARCPSSRCSPAGRSFGGRMTSQAQAASPLPGVRGLAFLGFPLHPAGKPSDERATHLSDVRIPMLFLQGTRDELAHLPLLQGRSPDGSARARRSSSSTDADHSFHVPARTGRKDADVRAEMADVLRGWMRERTIAARVLLDRRPSTG